MERFDGHTHGHTILQTSQSDVLHSLRVNYLNQGSRQVMCYGAFVVVPRHWMCMDNLF